MIDVKGLKKNYGGLQVLKGVDLTINKGDCVVLVGPSGCGKSTTLYMICGLQKPTSGRIFFGEDDVTDLSPENRGVGLVFQNYALYPHMTVKQNILFPLQNLRGADKLAKEEMLERAYEAARLVQIDDLMDRKPSELSGGQKTRVSLGKLLVTKPYGGVEQDDFLNGAIEIETLLSPMELLTFLQQLEQEAHRERKVHWGPRTLDLDILFYEDVISNDPKLLIPHRDMQNRRFVLEPLSELCPCYVNQLLQKTVYEMLMELPD